MSNVMNEIEWTVCAWNVDGHGNTTFELLPVQVKGQVAAEATAAALRALGYDKTEIIPF